MNKSTISNINSSHNQKRKQLWRVGDKYLVRIDESIIQKIGIQENSIVFLEQSLESDNTIRMKIKKF